MTVKHISENYSVDITNDKGILLVDATDGPITIRLPYAIEVGQLSIRKVDSTLNTITILAKGSDLIDNKTSYVLNLRDNKVSFHTNRNNRWWSLEDGSGTFSTLDIYVDDGAGDDSNNGTSASPVKTFSGAVSLIPRFVDHTVTIYIAPHTGTGYKLAPIEGRVFKAPMRIVGWESGSLAFNELLTGTTIAGTDKYKVVTSDTFTENQYRGKTLQILDGTQSGSLRTIHWNTTDTLSASHHLEASPGVGAAFRVVEPKVVIDCTPPSEDTRFNFVSSVGDQVGFGESDTHALSFINLKLSSSSLSFVALSECHGVAMGVEIVDESAVILTTERGFLNMGLTGDGLYARGYEDLSGTLDTTWLGWGLSKPSTGSVAAPLSVPGLGAALGYVVCSRLITQYRITICGGSIIGYSNLSCLNAQANGEILINPDIDDTVYIKARGTGNAIDVTENSFVKFTSGISVVNAETGSCVRARYGGTIVVVAAATISGSSDLGYGVNCKYGGHFFSENPLTLSGTLGETYDGNAVQANSVYASAGDHLVHTDGSLIERTDGT